MKMKALDSFYSSETGQVHAREEFEIQSEERAKEFAERGLAIPLPPEPESVAEAAASETPKSAPPSLNKMEPAPENKAAGPKKPSPGRRKPHKGAQ